MRVCLPPPPPPPRAMHVSARREMATLADAGEALKAISSLSAAVSAAIICRSGNKPNDERKPRARAPRGDVDCGLWGRRARAQGERIVGIQKGRVRKRGMEKRKHFTSLDRILVAIIDERPRSQNIILVYNRYREHD